MQKKIFSGRFPLKWPRDFTLENFSEFFIFFRIFHFFSILSTRNGLKWLPLCSASFLLELHGQERSDFFKIWPKMAEKWAKYAKIKDLDTLIKIESLVLTGNHFKWSLLCSFSSFLVLNGQKGFGFPEIWPNMAEKVLNMLKSRVLILWSKLSLWFWLEMTLGP